MAASEHRGSARGPSLSSERHSALETKLRECFSLTDREVAVAASLTEGPSYAEIGERLGVSYHTVHTHVKRFLTLSAAEEEP